MVTSVLGGEAIVVVEQIGTSRLIFVAPGARTLKDSNRILNKINNLLSEDISRT